jgi:hypothetical protein
MLHQTSFTSGIKCALQGMLPDARRTDPGSAEDAGAGIFRVWSTKLDEPGAFWRKRYPLTETAQKILAKWDPVHDTVASGCKPKGMPTIMEQPYLEGSLGRDDARCDDGRDHLALS